MLLIGLRPRADKTTSFSGRIQESDKVMPKLKKHIFWPLCGNQEISFGQVDTLFYYFRKTASKIAFLEPATYLASTWNATSK